MFSYFCWKGKDSTHEEKDPPPEFADEYARYYWVENQETEKEEQNEKETDIIGKTKVLDKRQQGPSHTTY